MKEFVYMVSGGVGAGKTTYAKKLCEERGGVHFSIDEWHLTLFLSDLPSSPDYEWWKERVHRIFTQMQTLTLQLSKRGMPVVLDLGFQSRADRKVFADWCMAHQLRTEVHFLDVPAETRWKRVQRRNASLSKNSPHNFLVPRNLFDFSETILEPPTEEEFDADLISLKLVCLEKTPPMAEQLGEMADRGEDVTPYLGTPVKGYAAMQREKNIQRTNVDFGLDMLAQLDAIADKLNISRQAVVKMAIQEYLTRYHISEKTR